MLICRLSPIIVEPYNAILATHFSMDYADVSFIVDNEALYDICANRLNVNAPTYTNLNRIIGQVGVVMGFKLCFFFCKQFIYF